MIPFFVVDRPISLQIIKGIPIPKDKQIGLMAHAYTTQNFRKAFREYPTEGTIKMCDSAIFHPSRNHNTYKDLFDRYIEMGANYGVMIDILHDRIATLESAKKALEVYSSDKRYSSFKLVGVAQGENLKDILNCYSDLKDLGFQNIAIGGLLQRNESTARYIKVKDEQQMESILKKIRDIHNPDWLFVLGCLHPSRIKLFKELNVWGDYKGWIFEYKKRDEAIKNTIYKFRTNHLQHCQEEFTQTTLYSNLVKFLKTREKEIVAVTLNHKELLNTKRRIREFINEIYQLALKNDHTIANQLLKFRNRSFLNPTEQKSILSAIDSLNLKTSEKENFLILLNDARNAKNELQKREMKLVKINKLLLDTLNQTNQSNLVDEDIKACASEIKNILSLTEQNFRINQVREFIKSQILSRS